MNERLTDMSMTTCPECRWVSVVDGAGRRRMEMRWEQPGTVTALPAARRSMAARAA